LAAYDSDAFALKFAGWEDTVDRVVTLDGRPTTIIGILPADFAFLARDADIWPILTLNPPKRRGPFYLRGVARLAPGVTLAQASSALDALGQEVERAVAAAISVRVYAEA